MDGKVQLTKSPLMILAGAPLHQWTASPRCGHRCPLVLVPPRAWGEIVFVILPVLPPLVLVLVIVLILLLAILIILVSIPLHLRSIRLCLVDGLLLLRMAGTLLLPLDVLFLLASMSVLVRFRLNGLLQRYLTLLVPPPHIDALVPPPHLVVLVPPPHINALVPQPHLNALVPQPHPVVHPHGRTALHPVMLILPPQPVVRPRARKVLLFLLHLD